MLRLAGEGSPADEVEGLVSAGVPHEGTGQTEAMEGLEPIAAHAQEAAPEGGWETQPAQQEGWETQPAAAGTWGDTASAPEGAPAGWTEDAPAPPGAPAANDWGATSETWGGAAGLSADVAPPQASDWGAEAESPGEQLPPDAILGEAAQPPAPPAEAIEEPGGEQAAEAPDAWAASEDPLAAHSAGEGSWGQTEGPPQWAEAAAETDSETAAATEEPASAFAPEVDQAFDLPAVLSVSVGPGWASLSPDQQSRLRYW